MNFEQQQAHANIQNVMADRTQKHPRNTNGPLYVDLSCTDCDLCRSIGPQFFARDDDTGYTFVHRQPQTPSEIAEAESIFGTCPSDSIGSDG